MKANNNILVRLTIIINDNARLIIDVDGQMEHDYIECMKKNNMKYSCDGCLLNNKCTGCLVAFPEVTTALERIISSNDYPEEAAEHSTVQNTKDERDII